MSYTAKDLLKLASDFDNVATRALVVTAKKKEKKKLDPKAKLSDKNKKDKKLKKKKASEYYDILLNKFAQAAEPMAPKGTPGNPYTPGELGETVELDTDEEGNPITPNREPVSFQRGPSIPSRPRFNPIPPEVQEALAKLGYKGSKGEPVVKPDGKGDGQLGPITQFALNQYREKNKDRAVGANGQPVSQELMYEMIKRDASGENKTKEQLFDAKATNDALNAAQAYTTQLEASLRGGQINAKNAAQTKQALSQYLQTLQQHIVGIYQTLQDNRSSQQERDSAKQMQQKYDGLRTIFERWVTYLDMLAKQAPTPMTDEKPYG